MSALTDRAYSRAEVEQMIVDATTECSDHWQREIWNAVARAGEIERQKIRTALLAMHEAHKHRHNYYGCAVVELFGS